MDVRVLVQEDVPATTRRLLWVDTSNGWPVVFSHSLGVIAAEDVAQLAFLARCQLAASPLRGKSVAWIGGGTCLGPRLFQECGCIQTVYEIEPALAEFCPHAVSFVLGDWRKTLAGKYDLIVYDLGEKVPRNDLTAHLKPGGVIFPPRNQND